MENLADGIHLFESSDSTITGNQVMKNNNGIYLVDSGYNTISWNTIFKNGYLDKASSISNEEIHYSMSGPTSGHGIFLDPSDVNLIEHNNIFGNAGSGIHIIDSDSTKILKNIISVNNYYGVYFDISSSESIINQNDFHHNNPEAESQGFDDGNGNLFSENYWSNYQEGDEKYPIDGGADNFDYSAVDIPNIDPEHEYTPPELIFPIGGETLSGTETIKWNGADSGISPPDEIRYWLFYSPDAGNTWNPLYLTITTDGSTYFAEWDTTTVNDGSEYMIQVLAIDVAGYVSIDTSRDRFTIKNGIEPSDTTTTTTDTSTTIPSLTPSWSFLIVLVGLSIYGILLHRKQK